MGAPAVRAVVLADTHIRDGGSTRLSDSAWEHVRRADLILHAGDVMGQDFLEELRAVAPVHAVLGNNDAALSDVLPDTVELELGGVRVAMIHDSGTARGRAVRLRRAFPMADLVVFGHSHIPWNEQGVDGQRLFNPGSPTQRRRQPHRTLGVLDFAGGEVSAAIVELD